jgi:hypothetical protein
VGRVGGGGGSRGVDLIRMWHTVHGFLEQNVALQRRLLGLAPGIWFKVSFFTFAVVWSPGGPTSLVPVFAKRPYYSCRTTRSSCWTLPQAPTSNAKVASSLRCSAPHWITTSAQLLQTCAVASQSYLHGAPRDSGASSPRQPHGFAGCGVLEVTGYIVYQVPCIL